MVWGHTESNTMPEFTIYYSALPCCSELDKDTEEWRHQQCVINMLVVDVNLDEPRILRQSHCSPR